MSWVRDRALGLVVMAAFWAAWIGQAFAQAAVFIDEQRDHGGHVADVWQAFTQADFWEQFAQSTLENWQSEFLQWGGVIILSAYLVYKGSAESSDGDERIEAKLDELLGADRAAAVEQRLPAKHRRRS